MSQGRHCNNNNSYSSVRIHASASFVRCRRCARRGSKNDTRKIYPKNAKNTPQKIIKINIFKQGAQASPATSFVAHTHTNTRHIATLYDNNSHCKQTNKQPHSSTAQHSTAQHDRPRIHPPQASSKQEAIEQQNKIIRHYFISRKIPKIGTSYQQQHKIS